MCTFDTEPISHEEKNIPPCVGIDFPIPRKTLIIKFPSPGTAKVPSAQELNDEASN